MKNDISGLQGRHKKVGFQRCHALTKALSNVKKYVAGQFVQFMRWESQKLVDLKLSRENGGVSKIRTTEIARLQKNF